MNNDIYYVSNYLDKQVNSMKEINKNLEDIKREIREKYDSDCSISKISFAVFIGISTILLAHHFFPTIFSFS